MLETWFHFYARLKPKGKLCLKKPTSFFNELEIEKEPSSQTSDSFFNVLDTEWELCSQTSVSFFNELDTE